MTIKLIDSSPAVYVDELGEIELKLGITFPQALKSVWLANNGGVLEGERRVYQSTQYENDIKYFLPVLHAKNAGILTVDSFYKTLVYEKKLLPRNFVPFAIDGGGFPYCIEINQGAVYFCDLENQEENILESDLDSFFEKILTEDEAWG